MFKLQMVLSQVTEFILVTWPLKVFMYQLIHISEEICHKPPMQQWSIKFMVLYMRMTYPENIYLLSSAFLVIQKYKYYVIAPWNINKLI